MENAAKALQIAGGVLIALIILALLIFTFKKMSDIPKAQEYQREVEQLSEFNKQYEAYEKNLMYGVDVLSCLNKVIDNNQRSHEYMEDKYNITISIKITKDVSDTFEVYNYDSKTNKEREIYSYDIGTFLQIFGDIKKYNVISSISNSTRIKNDNNEIISIKKDNNPYVLSTHDDNDTLISLSKSSITMEETKKNPDIKDYGNWSKVVWKTAAYNFKSNKFKCTKIGYDQTGRVNEIVFVEL